MWTYVFSICLLNTLFITRGNGDSNSEPRFAGVHVYEWVYITVRVGYCNL